MATKSIESKCLATYHKECQANRMSRVLNVLKQVQAEAHPLLNENAMYGKLIDKVFEYAKYLGLGIDYEAVEVDGEEYITDVYCIYT